MLWYCTVNRIQDFAALQGSIFFRKFRHQISQSSASNTMASLRLNICKNGSLKDVKPVVIKKDQGWDELLKMGSNKLRIKAKIIFDEYGNELLPENLTDGTINEKTLLIFSATNEFVGFKKEKEDKNKRIVGLTEEQKENLLDAAQKHYECTVRVISKERYFLSSLELSRIIPKNIS
jgi:hypothetical protein